MSKKNDDQSVFEGFEQSNTTPVPDIFFDELLSKLTGAEVKVLLYIIRRTAGFKKTADAISLSQFENGIVKADGTILDRGCGLGRETICKALASLEKKGCINSEKRDDGYGGKGITVYSIRFKGGVVGKTDQGSRKSELPNVVGKTDQGSRKNRKRVVGKTDLQETVLQQTESTNATDDSTTPNDSPSLAPSLFSLSDEDLLAEISRRQRQQGTSSTPTLSTELPTGVDNGQAVKPTDASLIVNGTTSNPAAKVAPAQGEPVTTRNTSNETNPARDARPPHDTELSPEEQRIQGYWQELGFEAGITPKLKEHWGKLTKHTKSFEQFKSLYEHTRRQIENNPEIKNKRVSPGNLTNANNLNGWKQAQQQQQQSSEPKPQAPKPYGRDLKEEHRKMVEKMTAKMATSSRK